MGAEKAADAGFVGTEMVSERSDTIFHLASEFGIPVTPGAEEPLEDAVFSEFKRTYLEWSDKRDQALAHYLARTPTLFRTYIPYGPTVFYVASQIVWYLDEILISDPIVRVLKCPFEDLEKQKNEVRKALQLLSYFKSPIEAGYILFAGSSLLKPLPDERPEIVEAVLAVPEVRQSLAAALRCGFIRRVGRQGEPWFIYELKLPSGGIIGFEGEVPAGGTMIPLKTMGEDLPQIDLAELRRMISRDPLERMESVFARAIHKTLFETETAKSLGSAVLFDQEVNGVILSNTSRSFDDERQIATASVLDTLVPYVRGIPPDRLAALRDVMPAAFRDFRGHMVEITRQVLDSNEHDVASLRFAVERKVLPGLRCLDAEMLAALKKARVLKRGLPLAAAAAMLTGAVFDVPIAAPLAFGLAGSLGSIKAEADEKEAEQKAKGNPFYFLWRVQKK